LDSCKKEIRNSLAPIGGNWRVVGDILAELLHICEVTLETSVTPAFECLLDGLVGMREIVLPTHLDAPRVVLLDAVEFLLDLLFQVALVLTQQVLAYGHLLE